MNCVEKMTTTRHLFGEIKFVGQNTGVEISKEIKEFIKGLDKNNIALFPYLANMSKEFDPSKDTVFYSGPYWDYEEVTAAIESLLAGKWLSSGEKVHQFERAFSKRFEIENSVMVNSGSSANLVMIAALKDFFGWQDDDEIIVSVVGFPTTTNSVLQNNLQPVFVDINWDDLNWNIESIIQSIGPKTRAIFCSPVLGNPGNFGQLIDICNAKQIELILDNCDSLGTKWEGRFLNEYAIASSCSFYPAHHITTMEGGMVSSRIEEITKLARSYSWWGRGCYCVGRQNLLPEGTCKKRFSNWISDCPTIVDHKYVFDKIGYNLKPLDLQGAIGVAQLKKFDEIHAKRISNKDVVDRTFGRIAGCRVIQPHKNSEVSWFGAPVICATSDLKQKLVSHLEKNRIQTRNYFSGNLLMQPGYTHLGNYQDFPNATKVLEEVFFVGVSPTINISMLNHLDDVVTTFLREYI
jgi:CDP-6-deoxy-D-xylo-4-hexulose-3-dehydrase